VKNGVKILHGVKSLELVDYIRRREIMSEYMEGRWIKTKSLGDGLNMYVCSVCGRKIYSKVNELKNYPYYYPYCRCGAMMQKVRKHE
jgi:hypothetical protein